MTDTTLEQRGRRKRTSHWVKRTVLVTFCLGLLGTLGVVFTRVIAARVPEQRATLEKLITDRTGLAVRFDNVHFAWDLDGTSAVFTRVELTDPKRGRVRVVAPELRVEFDTWDFLRHHQFSLGHVTLSSPDIEIIGDPEDPQVAGGRAARRARRHSARDAGRRSRARAPLHRPGPSSCPTAASKSKARVCICCAAAARESRGAPQLHAEPGGGQPRQRQLQRLRHHAAVAGRRPVAVRVRQARGLGRRREAFRATCA